MHDGLAGRSERAQRHGEKGVGLVSPFETRIEVLPAEALERNGLAVGPGGDGEALEDYLLRLLVVHVRAELLREVPGSGLLVLDRLEQDDVPALRAWLLQHAPGYTTAPEYLALRRVASSERVALRLLATLAWAEEGYPDIVRQELGDLRRQAMGNLGEFLRAAGVGEGGAHFRRGAVITPTPVGTVLMSHADSSLSWPAFIKPSMRDDVCHIIGQVLNGRYRIERQVDHGGMGAIYLACDMTLNDDEVAVKALLPNVGEWVISHFDDEIQALVDIDNPHIVKIRDKGVFQSDSGELRFLVMEYVEGENLLTHILRCGPLSCVDAAGIALQVASGLAETHEQGIFHRDIKPQNILLDSDVVKITDFGIASIHRGAAKENLAPRGVETNPSSTVGTPGYMAPEQIDPKRFGEVAAGTDIYALGVVMYNAVTQYMPFGEGVSQQLAGDYLPPSRLNPYVDPDFEAIIAKCLQLRKEDRYHSAQELMDALRRYQAGVREGKIPIVDVAAIDRLARSHALVVGPESVGLEDTEGHRLQLVDAFGDVETYGQVVQRSVTQGHTLMLREDGTVFGDGFGDDGELGLGDIQGATFVAAGPHCSYVVTERGDVVIRGYSPFSALLRQRDLQPVREVSCGSRQLALLHRDGALTIFEVTKAGRVRERANCLTDVQAVCSSDDATLVLHGGEGRVTFFGPEDDPRDVRAEWLHIHAIALDDQYAYGLRGDGTLEVMGSPEPIFDGGRFAAASSWRNILAIDAHYACLGAVDVHGMLHLAGDFQDLRSLEEGWRQVDIKGLL